MTRGASARGRMKGREEETANEKSASICCFSTLFSPNTRHRGHLSDTLSSHANVSSRNTSVEDEKTDRGLVFKAY